MNRKVMMLNLALVALTAALGWLLREHWRQARAYERVTLRQAARAKAVTPPPPAAAPKPVAAAEYLEVAQKMLFSKDRNPNVILPPPPAPPPEPPMPPLPAYHGQMAIGDPVVFLSVGANGAQKSYKTGEKVGDFEVVSFDRDKITLAWNGKTVERKLQELAPKETAPLAQQPQPAPAPQSAAAPSGVVALGGTQNADSSAKKNPLLGNDSGGGIRSCVANDKTPAGTVVDGYKKVISQGMFGDVCRWELVK